jgi:AcrR family transcriptional regulator
MEERRDQIVAAARLCFRQHGFHGSGMAEIAQLSRLSVGQIYRCFINKEAIIEEIVHRIVTHRARLMLDNNNDLDRIADDLAGDNLWGDGEEEIINQALMLEVSAEATRNPRIAQILIDVDAVLFQQGCTMLQQAYPGMNQDEAATLAELLAVLCEGTMLRILTRQRQIKPEGLQRLYRIIFAQAFPARIQTDFKHGKQ